MNTTSSERTYIYAKVNACNVGDFASLHLTKLSRQINRVNRETFTYLGRKYRPGTCYLESILRSDKETNLVIVYCPSGLGKFDDYGRPLTYGSFRTIERYVSPLVAQPATLKEQDQPNFLPFPWTFPVTEFVSGEMM